MSINKYFKYPVTVASELFSAGWCNLACKYCYIPKTDFLKKVHNNIEERIKDGSFIEDYKEMFGEELESVAHWGTEPTLLITKFGDFYKQLADNFPKINSVMLSSNFMTNPNNIITWVNDIVTNAFKKPITIKIQISLDGPKWITDVNREQHNGQTGQTDIIIKNIYKVLSKLKTHHTVRPHFKPTIHRSQFPELVKFDVLKNYYDFFEDIMAECLKYKNVQIQRTADMTLVVPDEYTKEDGQMLAKIYDNIIKLSKEKQYKAISQPKLYYYYRFTNKLEYYQEFFTKPKMWTCSAGDSSMGLGDIKGTMHTCHRSFYINHPEYEDEARKWGLDNLTMEGIESGKSKTLAQTSIANVYNEDETIRMLYVNRGHHDFVKFRLGSGIASILELANIGELSEIYKNIEWAEQLAMYLQTTVCHMDNTILNGCNELNPLNVYRLFGNGVFEKMLEEYCKND